MVVKGLSKSWVVTGAEVLPETECASEPDAKRSRVVTRAEVRRETVWSEYLDLLPTWLCCRVSKARRVADVSVAKHLCGGVSSR